MRISHVSVEITVDDINSMIADLAPEAKINILDITKDGIRGQVRVLFWNVDFIARPGSGGENDASIDVSAHKLVAIPGAIVNQSLRQAVKDAPPGIDVLRQSLKIYLPTLLSVVGMSLKVRELACYDGFLRLTVADVKLPELKELLGDKGKFTLLGGK